MFVFFLKGVERNVEIQHSTSDTKTPITAGQSSTNGHGKENVKIPVTHSIGSKK